MKSGVSVLNLVLLALVGVLFYLHFSSKTSASKKAAPVKTQVASSTAEDFRIAYFDMDSVTNSLSMVKDVKSEISREEENINGELRRLEKSYQDRMAYYQTLAQKQEMTQVQSEKAQMEMMQLQENIRNKKQELDQRYQNLLVQKRHDVNTKIEGFLKEYNKDRNFSYIISYEPGFIYYKDTMFNITGDLIKGLNSQYTGKKK